MRAPPLGRIPTRTWIEGWLALTSPRNLWRQHHAVLRPLLDHPVSERPLAELTADAILRAICAPGRELRPILATLIGCLGALSVEDRRGAVRNPAAEAARRAGLDRPGSRPLMPAERRRALATARGLFPPESDVLTLLHATRIPLTVALGAMWSDLDMPHGYLWIGRQWTGSRLEAVRSPWHVALPRPLVQCLGVRRRREDPSPWLFAGATRAGLPWHPEHVQRVARWVLLAAGLGSQRPWPPRPRRTPPPFRPALRCAGRRCRRCEVGYRAFVTRHEAVERSLRRELRACGGVVR